MIDQGHIDEPGRLNTKINVPALSDT